jgi:hypothetical protein
MIRDVCVLSGDSRVFVLRLKLLLDNAFKPFFKEFVLKLSENKKYSIANSQQ